MFEPTGVGEASATLRKTLEQLVANEILRKNLKASFTDDGGAGRCVMDGKTGTVIAEYMGLRVEVLYQLLYWSLISFEDQEVIVETADLIFDFAFEQAA